MTPLRPLLLPPLAALAAALAACGGGPSDDPGGGGNTVVIQKGAGSGDGQSAVVADTLPIPLTVLVTEGGDPSPGRVVNFAPLAGSGSVVPAVDTTGADGLAHTAWILPSSSGLKSVRAISAGASGSPLTFTATALPGPAAGVVVTSGAGQSQEVGLAFDSPLVVRVTDAFGNPVSGIGVAFQVTAGSVTLGAGTDTTEGGGTASVTVTAGGSPGPAEVQATAAPLGGAPVGFGLTVTPLATVILVGNNFFSPAVDTIVSGAAVKWVWNAGTHNVAPSSGPAAFMASPILSFPAQYGPLVFEVPGTYVYECHLHAGMTGTLVVQ